MSEPTLDAGAILYHNHDAMRDPTSAVTLRPARRDDARSIRKIIRQANINPLGLDWRHFTLAVDGEGQIIGTGQVKVHADGSRELSSIAVLPAWRGIGIARLIITHLLEQHPGEMYLTCQASLGSMYGKFGFRVLHGDEMPPYFRRIRRMVDLYFRLIRQPSHLLVMRRE